MSITFSDAAARMRTARNGQRKLENNTYLREAGPDAYAVRLHHTDVITINRDGTYVLRTGGWETITTKDRINSYGPARVYSERGVWAVWASDDPRTPPKIQKCRTCKSTGTIHTPASYRHWDYSQPGSPVRLDPPVETYPASDSECWNCHGTGQADYGSKPMPVIFFDGVTVDSSGTVVGADGLERLHEPAETIAARLADAEKAARAARRNIRRDWIRRHKLATVPGAVIMFKAVNDDLRSDHGTLYSIGTTVTADDYARTRRCGAGLHFSPAPMEAERYARGASRYLACAVDRKSMIILDDKVKARSCQVLYEVDYSGNRLPPGPP